jgi:hypothetical protein
MVSFNFDLSPQSLEQDIGGLSRGHLTIRGDQGIATSEGKQPDQSMMLFISISELLDGLRRFLHDKNAAMYRFIGVDSSFQLLITRLGDDRLKIEVNGYVVDEVPTFNLIRAVWEGVRDFIAQYGQHLPHEDPASDDLRAATKDFEETFQLPRLKWSHDV